MSARRCAGRDDESCGALNDLQHTAYPFLFPSVLLARSVYALGWPRFRDGALAVADHRGPCRRGVAGLGVNMRTSYWPVFVAMLAVLLIFAVREWQLTLDATMGRVAVVAGVFAVVACGVFSTGAIDRCCRRTFPSTRAHHPIAHSLVLALANPENPLSRREGIEWLDDAGLRIAGQIDPQVIYLGPRYGPALFRYYRRLWTTYPGEMAQLYLVKFKCHGRVDRRCLARQEACAIARAIADEAVCIRAQRFCC